MASLVEFLSRAVVVLKERLAQWHAPATWRADALAFPALWDLIPSITTQLQKDTRFASFDGRAHMIGGVPRHPRSSELAEWLILRSLDVGGERALADVERYSAAETVPYSAIVVLGGISVTKPVDLTRGISLIPFAHVPASYLRDRVERETRESFHHEPPAAALLSRHVDRKLDEAQPASVPSRACWPALLDSVLPLSLIGPCSPYDIAFASVTEEWVPCGYQRSVSFSPILLACKPRPLAESDHARARNLHDAWFSAESAHRDKLQVPIARLNLAMRRQAEVESAADLGISIESLFVGQADQELSYRARVNAAWLLGRDGKERTAIFHTVGRLYGFRSRAVHTGKIDASGEVQQALEAGYSLVARAAERILLAGKWPDWQQTVLDPPLTPPPS